MIVVLILLASGTLIGVSAVNLSVSDSTLAGNFNAVIEAQQAAENAASQALEDDDLTAANQACSEIAQAPDATAAWTEVLTLASMDGQGYTLSASVLECESDGFTKKLSRGQVRAAGAGVAEHFILFSMGAGGPFDINNGLDGALSQDDLDIFRDTSILAGGPETRHGNSTIKGPEVRANQGLSKVPDPGSVIDYLETIKNGPRVVESCDTDITTTEQTRIVYCDGDFSAKTLEGNMDGLYLVTRGSLNGQNGKGVNLKGDIETFLIAGGAINVKGIGGNRITGGIWAGGSLSMSGGPDICGPVLTRGALTFNGASSVDVKSENCQVTGGAAGREWRAL